MKICPECGYRGELAFCPNDGARLTLLEQRAPSSIAPTAALPEQGSPTPITPTASIKNEVVDEALEAEECGPKHPSIARVRGGEGLRDEDFGRWAAPKVKKSKDPMIGRLINERYQVIGLLGEGGMGAVYKAYQPRVQRMIALKVLLQRFTDNAVAAKRFHQEALAASRLRHPHTIEVYDFGQTEDGILYMAMEYLRGESLAQLLEKGPLPQLRAVRLLRQVCKSLSEAHKVGIIHRDLKPDNIFLTDIEGEGDFIKVLDFGVAKLREYDGKEGTLTQAGMIFGTPKYMSPEQSRSMEDLDARSDIYALGAILYEMLTGQAPFMAENPLSILIAHINTPPIPPRQVAPDRQIHLLLERVVLKALEKQPSRRQADVGRLLSELEAVEQAIISGVTQEAEALGLLDEVDPMELSLELDRAHPQPPRSGRGLLFAVVFAALVGGGLLWSQGLLDPRPTKAPLAVARLDVGVPSSTTPLAPDAAPSPPKAIIDAAVKASVDAEVKCVEVKVKTRPRGAIIYNRSIKIEDKTPYTVCLKEPTKFWINKKGYKVRKVLVKLAPAVQVFDLEPSQPKPPPSRKIKLVKTKPKVHLEPSAKSKLAKPDDETDIDLQ